MEDTKPLIKPFRANAHLLKLLGDELIGDDRLAVFELVKNAYDANATKVDVTLNRRWFSQTLKMFGLPPVPMESTQAS